MTKHRTALGRLVAWGIFIGALVAFGCLIQWMATPNDIIHISNTPIPRLLAVDKIYHLDGTQPCVAMFWDDGHVYTASPNDLTTWTRAAHVTPHQENP